MKNGWSIARLGRAGVLVAVGAACLAVSLDVQANRGWSGATCRAWDTPFAVSDGQFVTGDGAFVNAASGSRPVICPLDVNMSSLGVPPNTFSVTVYKNSSASMQCTIKFPTGSSTVTGTTATLTGLSQNIGMTNLNAGGFIFDMGAFLTCTLPVHDSAGGTGFAGIRALATSN